MNSVNSFFRSINSTLRAYDHYTSGTLIGGKGRAGPSSLHTKLEGPTKYVNARCMWSLYGFLHDIKWIIFHRRLDYFQIQSLGGRSNTKPGDRGTLNAHKCWLTLFYHVWGPAWIDIHWNSIWLRAQSHRTSHYTWGSVTTLHDFGGVLGRLWDTFFWVLTISWSRLLARVWSRAQHFPSNLYSYPYHNHQHQPMRLCPPMPTHAIQIAPMYSKFV